MPFDGAAVIRSERSIVREQRGRDSDLADVVQEGGETYLSLLGLREAEPIGEERRVERRASGMAAHERILRLDRVGQHFEERQRALMLDRLHRREVGSGTLEDLAEPAAAAALTARPRVSAVETLPSIVVPS